MKKKTLIGHIVFVVLVLIGCYGIYSMEAMESRVKDYYTMEDFENIEIGKSTLFGI